MSNTALYESDLENDSETPYTAADDIDPETESLVDIQSPADGYFESRNHPQQRYVPNPADPATKSKEAEIERLRDNENSADAGLGARQERWPADDESQVPVLDAGPAPPDYEAATAGQREQRERAFRSDHPLVRNGLLGEHGVFGGGSGDSTGGQQQQQQQQPQSMTDPATAPRHPETADPDARERFQERDAAQAEEQVNEETYLLRRSQTSKSKKGKKRKTGICNPRCWKSGLMVLGIIFLIILAIIATQLTLKHDSYSDDDDGDNKDKDNPDTKLPIHDGNDPPTGPTPRHPSHIGKCSFDTFSKTESFALTSLGDAGFEFLELIDFTDYRHTFPKQSVKISGTVQISPALEEQEDGGPDVKVWVNAATTKPIEIADLKFTLNRGSVEVRFPRVRTNDWEDSDSSKVCFDISVAIHVRKGTKMGKWKTKTANMDIIVEEGVFGKEERETNLVHDGLVVEDKSQFSTTSGVIKVAYWQSRRTIVETRSGGIQGTFALRDLLSLSAKSGGVNVDVDPKKADEENPMPAEFVASSKSGSVRVEFPTDDDPGRQFLIPERDYRVEVQTKSGGVYGTYYLGRTATFSTKSGDVKVGVMPYSSGMLSSETSLKTDVKSGTTDLELLQPYHADSFDRVSSSDYEHREGIIDALKSVHKSFSGDVKLKYPQEWEGRIDVETMSGVVRLRGKDVQIWAEEGIPRVLKKVIGHKGTGKSDMKIETLSGDVDVLAGEEW